VGYAGIVHEGAYGSGRAVRLAPHRPEQIGEGRPGPVHTPGCGHPALPDRGLGTDTVISPGGCRARGVPAPAPGHQARALRRGRRLLRHQGFPGVTCRDPTVKHPTSEREVQGAAGRPAAWRHPRRRPAVRRPARAGGPAWGL